MADLIIYGKSNCPWCDKAKDLADMFDMSYEYLDISDKDLYDQMKMIIPTAKTVPQIISNEKNMCIGGYEDFKKWLDA